MSVMSRFSCIAFR